MVLPIQINAVERFLHGVLVECGTQVIGDLVRRIELHFFTEGNEGVAEFAFKNAHHERSREPRSLLNEVLSYRVLPV